MALPWKQEWLRLTTDSEIRQLQATQLAAAEHPVDVVSTFMGPCHPTEYKDNPGSLRRSGHRGNVAGSG